MKYSINGNQVILGCDKEIYWPAKETLIISDLHLGKTNHFSQNGIKVPQMANQNNYWRLSALLKKYSLKRVIFLGDLFHSVYNKEWEVFSDFLANFEGVHWVLIEGNHDILDAQAYNDAGIEVVDELREAGIRFSHEPLDDINTGEYNLCGHIHPAVRLSGTALQSLRLPCFFFGKSQGIMPAYGEFTGTHTLHPKKGDSVFVIAENTVMELS